MVTKTLLSPELVSLIGLLVLIGIIQAMSGSFFTKGEISGVTLDMSTIGLIGVGVTILMISGEFDLSVETTAALAGIVMAELITTDHLNPWLSALVALGVSGVVGLINGVITVVFRIPSFIATLGMFYVLGAVNFVITNGNEIELFGHGAIFSLLGGQPGGLPFGATFIWMLGIAIIGIVMLTFTRFGSWTFAAGSKGGRSAEMIGVPVRRVKLTNFVLCSTLAGLAGLTGVAQFGSVSSGFASGDSLVAIVATVVGGTPLVGGRGSVQGTIVGSALVAVLGTGLILVGAPGSWYTGIIGILLIVAVIFNVRAGRIGNVLAIARADRSR